jgi:hypothetical protein
MTDQELVLRAVTELQLIAADYIEPDSRDAEITMQMVLSILDRGDVVAAVTRLSKGYGLRVVK